MVLPSLILLVMVLFMLTTAVLMRGTSSLKTATFDQQTDQAIYAAETGISRAVEEYRRLGDGSFKGLYEGELEQVGSSYKVTPIKSGEPVPAGVRGVPELPPNTVYLLAEGTSANGTRRRAGALFRTGLGAFEAGIITRALTAKDSEFNAYDSTRDKDPEKSRNDNTALLANLSVPTGGAEQFSFDNTLVRGGVYVAPGTEPSQAIKKSGTTKLGRESILASPITVAPVEVPTDLVPGGSRGEEEPAVDFDGSSLARSSVAGTDLQIIWIDSTQTVRFRDGGIGFFRDVALADLVEGRVSSININNDGNNRLVNIGIQDNRMTVRYDDYVAASGVGQGQTSEEFIISNPINSPLNPDRLSPGKYGTVTIEAGRTTILEGGTFLIDKLVVEEGGTLRLPDGKAKIYVEGQLAVKGKDTLLNETQQPPNLQVFFTGYSAVELSGGSKAYFTLVAPNAEINLNGGLEADNPTAFYGALLGGIVKVSNTNFYYDTAAEKVGTGSDGLDISLINRHRL